jgi:hypothetical protein
VGRSPVLNALREGSDLAPALILAARRLAQLEFKRCPAYGAVIANAIVAAEKILRRIDSHWPKREQDGDF